MLFRSKGRMDEREEKLESRINILDEEVTRISAMEDEMKFYRKKIGKLTDEKVQLQREFDVEKEKLKEEHDDDMAMIRESHEAEKKSMLEEFGVEKEKIRTDLMKKEKAHVLRVDEIKAKTKETISSFITEKDGTIDKLRNENEGLKKNRDKLIEKVRMLEVEHM